jgi:NADPH:quinone reductase-like Zn-dependent oxidoreductase
MIERGGARADYFIVDVSDGVLDRISGMLVRQTIVPNVGLVLPFAQAPRAHELLAAPTPGMRGKIVLSMDVPKGAGEKEIRAHA